MSGLLREVGRTRVILLALGLLLLFTPGFPFHVLFGVTLLNLALRENFPFSHFPMFASFSPRTDYLLLTDEQDRPVALESEFGVSAGTLRKRYYTTLHLLPPDSVPRDRQAGELLLHSLLGSQAAWKVPSRPGLRLYLCGISSNIEGIYETRKLLAEAKRD